MQVWWDNQVSDVSSKLLFFRVWKGAIKDVAEECYPMKSVFVKGAKVCTLYSFFCTCVDLESFKVSPCCSDVEVYSSQYTVTSLLDVVTGVTHFKLLSERVKATLQFILLILRSTHQNVMSFVTLSRACITNWRCGVWKMTFRRQWVLWSASAASIWTKSFLNVSVLSPQTL